MPFSLPAIVSVFLAFFVNARGTYLDFFFFFLETEDPRSKFTRRLKNKKGKSVQDEAMLFEKCRTRENTKNNLLRAER